MSKAVSKNEGDHDPYNSLAVHSAPIGPCRNCDATSRHDWRTTPGHDNEPPARVSAGSAVRRGREPIC